MLTPAALVARAAASGITVLGITDHDTTAGLAEARAAASRHGVRLVEGVEITAVENGRDVHVLGYFVDPGESALVAFLDRQRADRVRRVQEMAQKLEALGCAVDYEALLAPAGPDAGRSIGRPQLAQALVAAGHARDPNDAFDRLLGSRGPAFVPRRGASPDEVIDVVRRAGGLASIAHPGLTDVDRIIPRLAAAGLTALEARHSDHDAETEQRYRNLAAQHGLVVSGGSDFHGDSGHRIPRLGVITLPAADFAALEARLR
jgi:predicted metal-dependent phosphoesterase TrpH